MADKKIIRKESVKVIDPIRLPNVQLPYETDARKSYKRMTDNMVKMISISLLNTIES